MRKETSEWSIRMLVDLQSRIKVDAEFQRGPVWSEAQQALLIDSIFRGFDIPKIYLQKLTDGSQHLFNVIDGKQRLTAIWRFVSNDLKLLPETDFQDLGDLSGLCWSKLSSKAKDRLQFAISRCRGLKTPPRTRSANYSSVFRTVSHSTPLKKETLWKAQ